MVLGFGVADIGILITNHYREIVWFFEKTSDDTWDEDPHFDLSRFGTGWIQEVGRQQQRQQW